jgi:hypothetical protein
MSIGRREGQQEYVVLPQALRLKHEDFDLIPQKDYIRSVVRPVIALSVPSLL